MKMKTLLLVFVIFSLIFAGSALAQIGSELAMGPVDEIGAIISGYIVFIGVVVGIFLLFDLLLVRMLERHGMKSFVGGPKMHATLMVLGLLLVIVSNYVVIPAGVIMIFASLIFVMIFLTIIQAIVIYAETHISSETAMKGIIKGEGRVGKKSVKAMEEEEKTERAERETIVEIFDFLRENPGIRESIRTALESSRETKEPINLPKELKKMYLESKGERVEDKVVEAMEASIRSMQIAMGEAKAAKEEEILKKIHLIHREARRVGDAIAEERKKTVGEKIEERNILLEVYRVVKDLLPGAEELAETADDEDDRKSSKEHVALLKEFEKLIHKLAKELEIEIKEIKKEEHYEDKGTGRRMRKKTEGKAEKEEERKITSTKGMGSAYSKK